MFRGVSLGTTVLEPLGKSELTMLARREWVAELLSHLIRIMYTHSRRYRDSAVQHNQLFK